MRQQGVKKFQYVFLYAKLNKENTGVVSHSCVFVQCVFYYLKNFSANALPTSCATMYTNIKKDNSYIWKANPITTSITQIPITIKNTS